MSAKSVRASAKKQGLRLFKHRPHDRDQYGLADLTTSAVVYGGSQWWEGDDLAGIEAYLNNH